MLSLWTLILTLSLHGTTTGTTKDPITSHTTWTPPPQISTTEVCEDVLDNCRQYGFDKVCSPGPYRPWAEVRCRKFCGFCGGPTSPQPCIDNLPNCNEYNTDLCENPAYQIFREDNCRAFCHLCDNQIQLVSTSGKVIPGSNAGRVEIYHNGWGTICDDMFGVEEAQVICRMLGFKLVVAEAFSKANFGEGSGTIQMDSLRCTGNETNIANCPFEGWGKNDCSHSEDAGVKCSELHLLLVGSTVPYEGRLEGQNSAGVWGEVISTGVTDIDALGVCRILGFDLPSAKVVSGSQFTQGVHNQVQANLTCIIDNVCRADPFSTAHGNPLGIECGHTSIRLVDGKMPLEGRVEVLHNGVWGTICAEHFTPQDAQSVCSSLGVDISYQNVTVHSKGEFGNGNGPSWLSNIQCSGSEKDIGTCRNISWAYHTCTPGNVAAVSCRSTSVMLRPGSNVGRVEIYHNGWGTICDDMFGVEEAQVICRMLGYKLVVAEAFSDANFGEGSGTIQMDSLRCTGNETDIANCPFEGWGKNDCSHREDAGVKCSELHLRLVGSTVPYEGRLEGQNSSGVWGEVISTGVTNIDALGVCRILGFDLPSAKVVSGSQFNQGVNNQVQANLTCIIDNICRSDPFSTANGTPLGIECGHTSVRLVDGKMPLEGRVEVLHNGVWGTICAEHFTPQDAQSVCSSLGVDISHQNVTVHSNGAFGNGNGPSWLSNIQCTGSEKDIGTCRNITWAYHTCTPGSVAAVSCPYTKIRLTGGVGAWEGRLEVFHSGRWGTVCGQGFEQPEADVVCKMLGYSSRDTAADILPNSYFRGLPSRNILLDQLGCFGSEGDITFCRTQDWGVTNCSHTQEVGVRCQTKDVRLMDGSHPLEGRVEVRVNGSWSTICDDHWDDLDATTVCRTLLQYPIDVDVVGNAYQGGVFGQGTGQVGLSYVQCNGTEENIFHCQTGGQRRVNCDHTRDAGVACYVGYNTTLLDSSNLTNDKEGSIHISGIAICDENWDENDARSVCRSLGFWSSSPTVYDNNWFGSSSEGGSSIAPQCRGNEANLAFCPLATEWGKRCSTSDLAGVRCNASPLGYHRVRLDGGDQPGRGRLLVEYNNNWGYVCKRGWTERDTVVVCRMLRYRSYNMTSTALAKGASPILVGDIECHGNETDIGLCKADLDKSKCNNIVVGVDCTDNVQAHLVNGTTPLDGRLEVLKDGQWATVCSSAVSTATAKVFCRMLGYSNTKPILKTFTDASSHVTINEMTCEGWEDHIGQCNHPSGLRSGCARNDRFVSLQCFNCSSRYSTETGEVHSMDYPQNYENSSDCLYVITPPESHSQYALVIQDLVVHDDDDFLDIREKPNGPSLGTFSHGDVFPIITGKQFYVRFHSNRSGSSTGFRLTWKPLALQDAITLNCGITTWNTVVNMTVLKSLYPDVGVSDLYLSNRSCTGTVLDDLVVFQQVYTDCSSSNTTTDTDIIFHNQLVYPNVHAPFPAHGDLWRVDVACNVKRQTNASQSYVPTAPSVSQTVDTGHHHLSGSSNYVIHLTFYQDPGFYQEIKESPITTHIGDNVYVKVDVNKNDPEVKMRLDTCVAKPTADAGPDLTYPLIQNGCVVDQDTTILSQGYHETKFLFNAFEFPANHNSVVVSCNATFCRADELSSQCFQTCHSR